MCVQDIGKFNHKDIECTAIDTIKIQHTRQKNIDTHHRSTTGICSHTHHWTDSSFHFYVQPGFIIISLIEWLAASCLCSYISMYYGSDETPFTWGEQQHGAKQVRQSLYVSQPGKWRDCSETTNRVKQMLRRLVNTRRNVICVGVSYRKWKKGKTLISSFMKTIYINCRCWDGCIL